MYTSVMNALLSNHPVGVKHDLFAQYGIDMRFDPDRYHFLLTGFKKQIYFTVYGATSDRYIELYLRMELEELLERHGYRGNAFLVFQDDIKQIALLFSAVDQAAPPVCDVAALVTSHVQAYYQRELIAGARVYRNTSALVTDVRGLDGAQGAFKRARRLGDLAFFRMTGQVFTQDTPGGWGGCADYAAVMDACQALERRLSQGDMPLARAALNKLVAVLRDGHEMALVLDALSFLKSALTMLFNVYDLDGAGALEALCDAAQYNTVEELHLAFEAVVDRLARRVAQQGAYQKPTVLAIYYINTHYGDRALSLGQIAEYALVSPNYLSGVFRAQTGHTITQYITRCRLDAACALLRGTSRKVGEISAAVGFDQVKYFSRLFKNRLGVYPQAYRARNGGRETLV